MPRSSAHPQIIFPMSGIGSAALEGLKKAPDFEPLATAFKRVANITRKAAKDSPDPFSPGINASLFLDPSETALYDAYQTVKKRVSRHLDKGDFAQALRDMASLRDPVDAFFVAVLVMADDPEHSKKPADASGADQLLVRFDCGFYKNIRMRKNLSNMF